MHTVHIKPTDIIDAQTGQSILEQVQSDLARGKLFFYFDFSSVYSLDRQALEKLIRSLIAIVEGGGEHRILSMNHSVHELFASKGLDTALNLD